MKAYTVELGKHDFKPNDQPFWLSKKRNICNFTFKFDHSMWYSIEGENYPTEGGRPYRGWNKTGFGFTQGLFTNTKRTCVVADFPNSEEGKMNLALYINDKKGNWSATDIMVVDVDKVYEGQLMWSRYTAELRIKEQASINPPQLVTLPLRRSNWLPLRGIGAWHGGKYPAPQQRTFWSIFQYI